MVLKLLELRRINDTQKLLRRMNNYFNAFIYDHKNSRKKVKKDDII